MRLSTMELSEASRAAHQLLDQLGLDAYLFEVEPLEGQWEVRVECAVDGGWQALHFPIDKDELVASLHDAGKRDQLIEDWRRRLSACKPASRADQPQHAPREQHP